MTKEGSIIYDTIDIGKRLAEIEKAKTPTKTEINKVRCDRCNDRGWVQRVIYPQDWRECPKCRNPNYIDSPDDESL